MAILEALERHEGFTDLEAQLAAYILEHADEVVGMKISELAQASYTSNATIVRLCHKTGLDGYRSFRLGLASEVEKRRGREAEVDADRPFGAGEGVKSVVASIAKLEKEAIDVSYAALDAYDVERVARAIRSAGHVYLFAYGDSELSCMAFANMLLKLGIRSTMGNLYGERTSVAHSVRRNDVVMVVSYRGGALRRMEGLLPLMRERRAKTVLVSTVPKPLGIDLALRIPTKEAVDNSGRIATYYSQACIRYALDCIYGELFELDYEARGAHKLAIDQAEVI